MKKTLFIVLSVFAVLAATAQTRRPQFGERPKLVVGIVVDQMRWDYLSRYYDQFGEGGFRRLINQGYSYDNCLINYVPTVTAIGHASVYTGTTPAFHGICGNNFYMDGKKTYCVADPTVQPVGSDNKKAGQMSPVNLLSTTIGDQLRLHTDFRSKVVGVSYKDRAAILPAGASATAAYWLDTKNGRFITSTYYMTELPAYVKEQNARMVRNKELKKIGERVGYSPLCGHLTTEMAIAALDGEQLGRGDVTDMLCISYSQTDVIGHQWGTRGEHTDEAYLELDKDIATLLAALDERVGNGNYLVFLTADHGAAHNFQFMQDNKLHGGKHSSDSLKVGLEQYVAAKMGNTKPVVLGIFDYRFYLDRAGIADQGLDLQQVKKHVVDYLRACDHISFVIDMEHAATSGAPAILRERTLLGWHHRRAGDVLIVVDPGYYEFGSWSSPVGTTHGEWNPYDAHIPMLFYGWHVPHGSSARETHITDFAATVCSMLHIQQPNACIGEALMFE